MTTLAFRDGVLAADGRVTEGSTIAADDVVKVLKVRGRLVGATGTLNRIAPFVEWLRKGEEGPRPALPSSEVIVVDGDTITCYESSGYSYFSADRFHAWGSGAPAALGALHCGATAKEAVAIAAKIDVNTGGRIRAVKL